MDDVDIALKSLCEEAHKSGDKRLVEAAEQVSTHLVLLKLSLISEQVAKNLSSFLSASLANLYAGVTVPMLRLASAIFEAIYHDRVLAALGEGQEEQRSLWESVLHALLSGILDYLDKNAAFQTKTALGDALLPILGDLCFSLSAPKTSVDLRCTAYNILFDSAASHQENQRKLRDAKVLGGERLGSCIWRTKDYLALESLLNLFARALPSARGSASGRTQRTKFIHSVFLKPAPPESAVVARKIADLLEQVSSNDWDETSLKIVDALAASSIYCPQPFSVREVVVEGRVYPSDRLYVDIKSFLVNVVLEREEQYESLEITYTTVFKVRLTRSPTSCLHVVLFLSSPPRLGKNVMNIKKDSTVAFSLSVEDETRFLQAMNSRGLAHVVSTESLIVQKLSLATEPTKLELNSTGQLVNEPTQDERIKNLSQLYRTDEPSDEIVSVGDSEDFIVDPLDHGTLSLRGPAQISVGEAGEKSVEGDCSSVSTSCSFNKSPQPLPSADNRKIFEAAFGTSDDDLSEFTEDEDCPPPKSRIFKRKSGATMTSIQGRISFEPVSSKAPTQLFSGTVGKTTLETDDEAPPASSRRRIRNQRRALKRILSTDIEPSVIPPVDAPIVTASTPTSEKKDQGRILISSLASGRVSGAGKVLRFSDVDIVPPDFNAPISSPPVQPKSALKSLLVQPPTISSIAVSENASALPSAGAGASSLKKSVLAKSNNVLDQLLPNSSSPTPGARRPIKENLRRKRRLGEASPPAETVKVKRKAVPEPANDRASLTPRGKQTNKAPRPAKRARARSRSPSALPASITVEGLAAASVIPSDGPPALRKPMQARKKYRARKGRALVIDPNDAVDKVGPTSGSPFSVELVGLDIVGKAGPVSTVKPVHPDTVDDPGPVELVHLNAVDNSGPVELIHPDTVDNSGPVELVHPDTVDQTGSLSCSSVPAEFATQVKREAEIIDLTFDSPPRKAYKLVTPICAPPEGTCAPSDTEADDDRSDHEKGQRQSSDALSQLLPCVQRPRVVRFTSPLKLPYAQYDHGHVSKQRASHTAAARRTRAPRAPSKDDNEGDETLVDITTSVGDPGLDAIVSVLNELHQVTVQIVANRFKGVKQEARASRDELLRCAVDDLEALYAQSIVHFNGLVELEAAYATFGRHVIHGTQDLVGINREMCESVALAVEEHDRGMLVKLMPAALVPSAL